MLKAAEVIQTVVVELRERCQCDFEADLISSAGFRCFPESPTVVTFRAVMTGSPQVSAPELATLLEDWTSSGAFLMIQAQLLSADGSCAFAISSFGERECNLLIPDTTVLVFEPSAETPSGISTTVIGSVIAVAVFAILLVVTVTMGLLMLVIVKRRRTSFKLQVPPRPLPPEP